MTERRPIHETLQRWASFFSSSSLSAFSSGHGRARDVFLENLAQRPALSIGMRRVTTGRNRERWTQAILPVSDCDSSVSVRADI
jgi:hypothetical protein